jgi:hypothetical protein
MAKQQDCFAKLKEISELYEVSMKPFTLLEIYYNEKNKRDKNAYNILCGEAIKVFACIMKMIISANDANVVKEMYSNAKSHLLRVGYDSYELICRHYVLDIEEILRPYELDDINNGFPDYYQKGIYADIQNVSTKLTECRSSSTEYRQLFLMYQETFEELSKHSTDIHKHIPSIAVFKEDRSRKEAKILQKENDAKAANSRTYKIAIIGIVITIAAALLTLLLAN